MDLVESSVTEMWSEKQHVMMHAIEFRPPNRTSPAQSLSPIRVHHVAQYARDTVSAPKPSDGNGGPSWRRWAKTFGKRP